jgi:hypothetical protein
MNDAMIIAAARAARAEASLGFFREEFFRVLKSRQAALVIVIYLAAVFAGAIRFSHAVKGFDVGVFLLLASVHLLVAVHSVVFAGTMAVFFRYTWRPNWIAATRFDALRQAKLNEANAIRTAHWLIFGGR